MQRKENQPERPRDSDPLHPSPLPPELAAFIRGREYACLLHATDHGTVLVVKLTSRDIATVRGKVLIQVNHELYDLPAAPVIRITTKIYDQPRRPLALETFINIGDPFQRADYESLASQQELMMLLYDERVRHRLTKAVGNQDTGGNSGRNASA